MTILINSPTYLCTPTYDKSGQVVHPSLIDFWLEYGISSWGGYRFWMAITPYPYGDDNYENPSLLVSQDGLNWAFPPGLNNPLDMKPGSRYSHPANYNSDPELIFDPVQNCLILFWRESLVNIFERLWSIKVYEDRLIEPKILGFMEPFTTETLLMSPAIWRRDEFEWYMWTCNGRKIFLHYSSDGMLWKGRNECKLIFSAQIMQNNLPWHLSLKPNYREKRLEFLICGSADQQKMKLWYGVTSMDNLLNIIAPRLDFLLAPSINHLTWDNDMIYRSTFTFRCVHNSYFYHIWYSARSSGGEWHLGYTEGSF